MKKQSIKQEISILLVEDNPDDALQIQELFTQTRAIAVSCQTAENLKNGLELLQKKSFDALLLNLYLPDSAGLFTLEQVSAVNSHMPVIIITGLKDEETGIKALSKGAQDYIVKGTIGPGSMERIIRYAIERKRHETRMDVSNQIMTILNRNVRMKETVHEILMLIKTSIQVTAVGIRLKENTYFPYYETVGFSDTFLRAEKYPCADKKTGTPILKCMCGTVIAGKTDPSLPFFTEYGSFWTNSFSGFFDQNNVSNWQNAKCDRCFREGYESVAMIPLKVGHEIIGLLQICHTQPDFFTPDLIAFFEIKSSSIGIALQRRRAEQTLVDSKARYRQLFDNMSSGVAVYDAVDQGNDFVFKDINPAGEKINQVRKTETIGRRILDVFPGARDMGLFNVLQTVYATGSPVHYPMARYQDARLSQWLENYVFKLATGEIVAVYDDKTREIEEETEKKELLVQLQQAQKMESIGTLAGGIAHDFNNILSAILGFSELAMNRDPNQLTDDMELKDDLSEILKAGTRAKELVKQILAFSRQTDHETRPLRVDAMIKEVAHLMRSTLPATIRIEKSIETGGEILADPTHIHQVLMNLCTNAYHAMRPKGGVLKIELRAVTFDEKNPPPLPDMPADTYAAISISDTGTGIARDILPRIFDPYFTTKAKGEGTGLGLAVAHGVVKSHNGHITVKSTPGKGTTFDLFFPAVRHSEIAADSEPGDNLPGGNQRILFVDDELAILKVNKIRLERLGYRVEMKDQSTEALALFEKHPESVDLIITDMTMPELTGAQLAKACLRIRPDIPIILCTGYSELISEAAAKEIGIRDYVMKPILIKDLANAIRRAVGENDE